MSIHGNLNPTTLIKLWDGEPISVGVNAGKKCKHDLIFVQKELAYKITRSYGVQITSLNSDGTYASLELYFVSSQSTYLLCFGPDVDADYYCPVVEGDTIEDKDIRIGPLLSCMAQVTEMYEISLMEPNPKLINY